MDIDLSIGVLLEGACASIKYRIKTEILGHPASIPEMQGLQAQILEDGLVREVVAWQGPDGWLGWDFHGAKGTETGIRIMCEKGVDPRNPVVRRALAAVEGHPERLERGLGRVGGMLDEAGLGGGQMIRATVCAYAGIEDKPFVKEQIEVALAGFKALLEVNSIKDMVEEYRGKAVFRQGVRWPSIYHLRLLAFTRDWRTPARRALIAAAMRKLVELSPIPDIRVRYKSQLISPASFCMHDFNPDLQTMDAAHWMMWFQRMELVARLGVVREVPELARQAEALERMLAAGGGRFAKKLVHPYFNTWGAYTGLRLEADWRAPWRREYDLTFRSLLILHYSGAGHG
jgi:hypothetical protein